MGNDITYLGTEEKTEIHEENNTVKKEKFKSQKYNKNVSKFITKTKKTLVNKKTIFIIAIIVLICFLKPITFLRTKLDEKREFYAQSYNSESYTSSYSSDGLIDSLTYSLGTEYYKNCRNTMVMPADGTISCPFDLSHKAIDIVCVEYQGNIYAAANGYVCYTGYSEKHGNELIIEHTINGMKIYTFYGNLSIINVTNGQYVYQNQVIAQEGGNPNKKATILDYEGHHLHFEVRKSMKEDTGLNPLIFIK